MPVFTYALPIKPGQTERVLKFGAELDGRGLRAEYDQLNQVATIRQHLIAIQPGPPIELAIHTLVCEDMNKLGRMFTSGAYDQWWLDFLRDVHGLDVRMNPTFPNPRTVFDSARPPAPAGPPGAGAAPGGPPAGAPRPPGPPQGPPGAAPGGPPPGAPQGGPPQGAAPGGPPPGAPQGGPPRPPGPPPGAPGAAPGGAPQGPPGAAPGAAPPAQPPAQSTQPPGPPAQPPAPPAPPSRPPEGSGG
jgi:hypothetical protein